MVAPLGGEGYNPEDNASPDPADSVGPGSGNYIRESELTMVTLKSVIKGGYGGIDVTKDEYIHSAVCPAIFRIMVKRVASDLDTSRKSVCRHSIRQGLSLLLARIEGVKEVIDLYETASLRAEDEYSPAAVNILNGGSGLHFLNTDRRQYQVQCYPEYRDILSDRAQALGIPSTKLSYICIFLAVMTIPLRPGTRKHVQQELINFSTSCVEPRMNSLKNIDKLTL